MLFADDGEPLRLGRTRRTFSRAQRRALAARDGGCRFPGCTMPPAWTEAHHILQWLRDAGLTDIDNGILLCRFHHLLIHNNGWDITREGGEFFVVPPASEDPHRRPDPRPLEEPTPAKTARDALISWPDSARLRPPARRTSNHAHVPAALDRAHVPPARRRSPTARPLTLKRERVEQPHVSRARDVRRGRSPV